MAGGAVAEKRVKAAVRDGAAQLVANRLVPQQPRDARERLQMIGAGAGRGQKHEDEVDRLVVDGLEVDRLLEPGEQAIEARQLGQPAVRQRRAVADAGRIEALALQQDLEDGPLVAPVSAAARFASSCSAWRLLAARKLAMTLAGVTRSAISIRNPCWRRVGSARRDRGRPSRHCPRADDRPG